MRKIYNITILLSVLIIGFIACNKDEENNMNTENNVPWTAEDLRIQNAILDFQSKIKNNSFKDGEMMSVEDALWNMEALINYNYSTPDSGFLNLTMDTTFEASIQINNGMVGFNDLVNVSMGIEEHVVNFINQIPSDVKFMIAADVTLKESTLKDGSSIITVTAGFGSDKAFNTPCYPPFEDDDYWNWGKAWANDGGYCDGPNVGQNLDSDAAEEIEYKLNNPQCIQSEFPGSYIVETYIPFIEGFAYPNPDDDQVDNNYDCLMFYQSTLNGPVDLCLSPEKMNFYLLGTLSVIQSELDDVQSTHPGEIWTFESIDVIGDYLLAGTDTDYLHNADIIFARRVIAVSPRD